MASSIKLSNVRLSFPDLFAAVQYEGKGPFRYNASFLIEPGSENDKKIRAAIDEAMKEKFKGKAAAKLEEIASNSNKNCYVKGDLKDYEGYAGKMVLSSHRKQEAGRPTILDGQKRPLTPEDGKPYAGCYVNASVDIYAQDGQNWGIRCGLNGVQFARDGDSFSGARAASPDDFDTIDAPEGDDDLA